MNGTKTEQILNALANGSGIDEYRGCCNTKTQSLLIDIYDRIDSMQPGGGTDFTGATASTAGKHGLVPAPQAGEQGKFLKGDGTWADVSGGSSELTNPLTASVSVGGVTAGKNYPTGTSLEQILRDILSPALYPTLTNPSATITGTGAKLLEKGSTLNATMTINFNRGSINPAYGTSGNRSGEATGYSLNGGTSQSGNTFNVTVTESNNTFSGAVAYAAGEQPKDSTGANYQTPLPAGSANTNTVTYEFVNALYGTTVNLTTMTKQPLVSKSAKQYTFNLVAQENGQPDMFDVPADFNVTAVQGFNQMTGQWQNISDFVVSDTTHEDAAGNTVAYKRYTDDRGYRADGREIKVIWS